MPAVAICGIVLVILVIIWMWRDKRKNAECEDDI